MQLLNLTMWAFTMVLLAAITFTPHLVTGAAYLLYAGLWGAWWLLRRQLRPDDVA